MIQKIVVIILKTFLVALLSYSVVFTLAVSFFLYAGYSFLQAEWDKVSLLKNINPIQTQYMTFYQGKNKDLTLKQTFIPLDSISKHLKFAVLYVEDAGFYQHPGVDLAAILQALETNKRRKRRAHGGSTITQQMAKNLFSNAEKTFTRKAKEFIFSLLMEKQLGKDRILELYLNYAQWGKDIFGCQEAAKKYYKKNCSNLTQRESIELAAVLANPVKYRPGQRKSKVLAQRRRIIVENLYQMHKMSLETFTKWTGDRPRSVKDSLYKESIKKVEALP
jgi:monofunctional biosynthetic peptidoglycan transglycosylase